jgi:hypothetical protein
MKWDGGVRQKVWNKTDFHLKCEATTQIYGAVRPPALLLAKMAQTETCGLAKHTHSGVSDQCEQGTASIFSAATKGQTQSYAQSTAPFAQV